MMMVKYSSRLKILKRFVVLTIGLFLALGPKTGTGSNWLHNNLMLRHFKKQNISAVSFIYLTEANTINQQPIKITCPENIYTYTDINSCSSYISGGLSLQFPENSLTHLSWEMTGATIASSEKNGINQIDNYTFNEGVTTITYTAEDQYNIKTTCSFTITIWDNQVPRLGNMPGDIVVSATSGECSASVSWREPTASDNCSQPDEIVKESTIGSGSVFPVGKTIVTYTAYDAMGNQSAPQSFAVTVLDKEPPHVLLPDNITINCEDEIPTPWQTFQQLTAAGGYAIDNCEVNESSFHLLTENSDADSCPLTITRTYEISDIHGNTSATEYLIHIAAPKDEIKQKTPILKSGAAEITAIGGNWSDPATWGGSVPGVDDNVIIPAGVTVIVDAASECNNITIEGTLGHSGATMLSIYGNYTNNGTYNAGSGTIEFTGTTDAVLTGSSSTDFENLIINKGTSLSPTLDVTTSISTSNFTLSNGTLKLSDGTTDIIHGFDVPVTAGIWVNGATLNTGDFSITNKGLINISSGSANFGNSSGNSVHTEIDGAFIMTGGVVNIAGRLENTASGTLTSGVTSGIHISGGTITLSTDGNGLSNVGSLNVTSNGTFDFTGGTIVFQNPSTATTELDLGLISGSGTKNTVGGTFQFGNISTPAGVTFTISSGILLDNITSTANATLTLNGNLTVNQLSLSSNGIDLNENALRISATSLKTYNFPIIDGNGNSIPVNVNLTSGGNLGTGDYIEILTSDSKHPNNASSDNYLNRYWTVTSSGITNPVYDISVTYENSDITGSDSEIAMGSWTGSLPWEKFGNANTSANTLTATGINNTNITFSGIASDPPTIEINSGNNTETICYGSSINLITTVTGDPAFSYVWAPTADLDLSDPANPVASPTSTTLYTVTVTDGNGFTASDNINVNVNPLPTASTSGSASICENEAYTLTSGEATSSNGTIQWTENGAGSITAGETTHTPTYTADVADAGNTVTLTMTVTGSGSCNSETATATYIIEVRPLPTATVSDDNTICDGESSTISVNLTGTPPWSITYQRDGSNDVTENTINSTPYTFDVSDAGIYAISALSDANCVGTELNGSATITVDPVSVGGTITGEATVCSGTNSTTLTLSGYTGDIQKWQTSTDGTNWTDISNTNDTYTATNLTQTTAYRAVVKSGTCSESVSAEATITIDPVSVGGTITGEATVCSGTNSTTLTLSGYTGDIQKWQTSTDGTNWTDISNTNDTYTATNLTQTTTYRAVVKSGACSESVSAEATITIDPISVGGTITGEATVCSGTNSTTLTLSGYTGDIQKWQTSTDGTNWIDVSNINDTYTATNLTQTTTYRAVVKSGTCSESVSAEATITVDPVPTVIAPEDQYYCMGETTLAIALTSTPEGAVFDITGGSSIGLSDKTGVTQIPSFTAIPGNAVIQITPILNGCTGETVSYNATVNARPNIYLSKSTETIGSGGSTTVSFSSSTENVTFNWEVFSIDGAVTGTSAGNGDMLNQTLFNNSATTGSVTYQITATSPLCEGATINYTVYVHPEVSATISGDNEVCESSSSPEITFTASGGTDPYTFTYTVNGGANQSITTTSGNSITLAVPTDIDDTYTYNLVSVSGYAGWEYPQTGTATVTVKPLPELTSTLTPTGICSNTAFTYTPTSNIGGTVFSWTRDVVTGISNSASSGTDEIDETLINTTSSPVEVTYTYTLTVNGCTNTQEVKVMVTQSPELTSNTSIDDICSGTLLEYTPTSSINPGTTFSWYRDADTYGNSANSGTGDISETLYNNSENPITVYYHYTLSSNGCSNPTDFLVEVTVIPAPEVSASASEYTICPNTSIDLFSNSNISSGLPATILTQDFNGSLGSWTRDPDNNNNGSWVPSSSYSIGFGNYITNGGSQFYISDMRSADSRSTLTSPSINTVGYTSVTLTYWHYYREGGSSDRARVRWSSDGSNWTDLVSYSSNQGGSSSFVEETISLPVGESSVYIQFYYDAKNDYYWAIDDIEIDGVAQSAADILWTSNTSSWTSTEANPANVTPSETTTYTVTYTDPDTGCNGSASTTVTVYPQPTPEIKADYCVVAPKIRLTATSGYSSYTWQPLPYGETDGNNYVDIDIAGIYTVNVVDVNGCSGAGSINVSNEYVTNGSFDLGNTGFTTPAATNGNQYQYVADDPSSTTELWPEGLYGIGDNAQNYHSNFWGVDHTSGTGNFMIVNGFPGSPQPIVWEQTITNLEPNTDYYFSAWAISLNDVGNDAQLQFSVNGNQLGTVADLTAIHGVSDNSNPWLDEGRFWGIWNSGSNTSAVLAIVDLQTAPNGNDFGLDDISFGILDPSPAEIEPSSADDVCVGGTIQLFANVSGGKEPITFSWVGPNGHTSTDENPVFEDVDETYDGTYTLTVTDWYGCDIPSETVDVKVYPQAIVDAGDDQTYGCSANTAFQLNGAISGAAQSSFWSTSGTGTFDDATKLDAIYTYSTEDIAAGTVTLTLTTDDPDGPCPATSDQIEITIYPSPELDITVENPLCYGYSTGSALASASNGTPGYSYSWSNGQTTAEATGLTVGSYKATVTDSKGCYDTLTINVVEPEPLIVYPPSFTPPSCYGGNDGTATINVVGGTLPYVFTWDAATGNQTTQTATGLSVGTYLFTVTDVNGCNITSDFVLVTQPDPPTLTCPPNPDPVYAAIGETTAPVTLEDPIYDPTCQTISWTMDGATVVSTPVDGIVPSPYTFNAGITTITYTTVNMAGDILYCSFEVEVIPNDPPDITCIDPAPVSATTDLCSVELSIDLPTLNAGSDITWEWEMTGATEDSGTGGITPNPHIFNVGITTITWTATNLAGSDVCTQTITITDDQKPTFTSTPFENCVDMLTSVVYTTSNPNPNIGTEPNLIKSPSPDYYTFKAGDISLDITDLTDNCCDPEDMTIYWQIDFTNTPDPLNPTGSPLTHTSVSGTGQPSTFGSDILFPGDGVYFTEVTHIITYWVEDCNGNVSDTQTQNIVVTPRPQIIKQN